MRRRSRVRQPTTKQQPRLCPRPAKRPPVKASLPPKAASPPKPSPNKLKASLSRMPAERLQKIIAAAGIASRRKAEELITGGLVSVNGKTVTELGSKADPSHDHI